MREVEAKERSLGQVDSRMNKTRKRKTMTGFWIPLIRSICSFSTVVGFPFSPSLPLSFFTLFDPLSLLSFLTCFNIVILTHTLVFNLSTRTRSAEREKAGGESDARECEFSSSEEETTTSTLSPLFLPTFPRSTRLEPLATTVSQGRHVQQSAGPHSANRPPSLSPRDSLFPSSPRPLQLERASLEARVYLRDIQHGYLDDDDRPQTSRRTLFPLLHFSRTSRISL